MKLSKYFLILSMAAFIPHLKALDFADSPLFLTDASVPNIVMMLDDSGSMDWEILTKRHWDACAYQPRSQVRLSTWQGWLDESDINGDGVMGDVVCFYNSQMFNGSRTCYDESMRGQLDGANRYNGWSSVRVRPGYGVRIYTNPGSVGPSDDIAIDNWGLLSQFDNRIRSFEIYRTDENLSTCGIERTNGLLYPNGSTAYYHMYPDGHSSSYWEVLSSDYSLQSYLYFWEQSGDWRVFSSDVNVTYFNPDEEYEPWSASLPDASFTAARAHGMPGGAGYGDTTDLTGSYYVVATDDKGFDESLGRPYRNNANSFDNGSNGMIDIWDTHVRHQILSSSIARWRISYGRRGDELGYNVVKYESRLSDINDATQVAEIKQNFANWYQYSRRRSFVVNSSISKLVEASPNYRYSYGLINDTTMLMNAPTSNANIPTHNTALLNDLFLRNRGMYGTPLRQGLNTVGSFLKTTGSNAPITEQCQQNFSLLFTDGHWGGNFSHAEIGNEDGDPYTQTVADVARYYYANDLRTDLSNSVPTSTKNSASHQHLVTFPVAFGVEGSLTDSDNDGWPDANGVQLTESDDWGDPAISNSNKINDLWHAAFNSKGIFSSAKTPGELVAGLTDALEEVDERVGSSSSVTSNSNTLRGTSRVYQASFNSSNWTGNLVAYSLGADGSVLTTPAWQAATLLDVRAANNRVIITSDVDATNTLQGTPFRHSGSSTLSSTYVNRLKSGRSDLGILGDVGEYAETLVDYIRGEATHESDSVLTTWTNCATENATCTVPGTTTVRFGASGSYTTKEVSGSITCSAGEFGNPGSVSNKTCSYATTSQYGYRSRSSKLGDLINSNPVYVGQPSSFYTDNDYTDFKTMWASRAGMVYVGGNDGMLHGFDADTGTERLAYVPYHITDSIYQLADRDYTHKYFVDGQVSIGDVCTGDDECWKTMLAGSLRTGGRGVYALDVTDPSEFSEDNATDIFLWEFGSADDTDMGYFFGQPLIVKLAIGKWAVIVSNGYNSDSGKAVLYILDAETGQPLVQGGKLDTGVGSVTVPNGLSAPTAVDIDSDGDVDAVYAGDLQGNMWKFDISSTNPSQWGVAFNSGNTPVPLFAGGATRPITAAPAVGRHPQEAGYMVYFGTGKYIETIDNSSVGQETQSFFGIWDQGDSAFNSAITSSDLLQQTILLEIELYPEDTNGDGLRNASDESTTFRLTSSNTICWRDCSGGASPHQGWRFDMVYLSDNRGEKQVTNPVLRNNRIIFTTLQPTAGVCDSGGRSWLMELNAADGSYLHQPPFDFNNDGEFDSEDVDYGAWGMVDTSAYCPGGNCQSPGGILLDGGIAQTPAIMDCDTGVECKYVSGSQGGIDKLDENAGANSLGRQSWRELRSE